jgi:hypothetical protein
VPGWEGWYEVSNLGRVYSVKRFGVSRSGRILAQQPYASGHVSVTFRRHPDRYQMSVHRLVLLTFVGPCPPNMETRHLDGQPSNNRLDNLCYGTRRENMADRIRHGTLQPARYVRPPRVGPRMPRALKPLEHGTEAGYRLHLHRKQPIANGDPCGCRRAHATEVRRRVARAAARRASHATSAEVTG